MTNDRKMRIGIFAYNFKHWKTQAGIQNLVYAGYKPEAVFAADKIKLDFYQSKIRIAPKDLYLVHPREVAEYHNIDYHVSVHNSEETSRLIESYELDLGIVLGARILKPSAFSPFTKGVMNMHPGILPNNRGLDTIKWAVLKRLPQGVTTHIIDEKIDRGYLIDRKEINIYQDDTLMDVQIRIQNLEQEMMLSSIKKLEEKDIKGFNRLSAGDYNKSVPANLEETLVTEFIEYKRMYSAQ